MGNTVGKTSQRLSDQFLSCSGNRKKKKLAKLSNGGLQPTGPSPGSSPTAPPGGTKKNQASWTKQKEEAVSLLSHRPLPEEAMVAATECQKPEMVGAALEKGVVDEDLKVQQSPKVMAAPPPSPAQQDPSFHKKPIELVLPEKILEGRELHSPTEEGDQHVSESTPKRTHNDSNELDNEGIQNSNSSRTEIEVTHEKTEEVENTIQEKVDEKKVEKLEQDVKPVSLSKQDDPIKDLENRQDAIFTRLHKIQNELDKMSICSGTSHQTSNGPSGKISFQDLVIGVDPSHVPFSLLVLYAQLSQHFKVKTSVFVHSTAKKPTMPHLESLLKSAQPVRQPDDCRTTNDLLLTFIYKQVRQDCSLMINPEHQTYIYGEVNVARYLSRLANPDYDANPVTATQIDHWLDLASLMLWNGNGKAKSQMVQNIDAALSKKKWLVGQDLSLADIVVWSGLNYANMMDKLPTNVQAWRKKCESHSYFNLVTKMKK